MAKYFARLCHAGSTDPQGPRMSEILAPNVTDRREWASRICAAWQAGVESIIETGCLIAAAKKGLEHGEFEAMVESDLPFGRRTAQMLMAVARDEWIANTKHASLLPPNWYTLYQLTRLDDDVKDKAVRDGIIRPDMERKQVMALKRITNAPASAALPQAGSTIADLNEAIERGAKYGCIYADPPWLYDNQGTRAATGNHYKGMTVAELCLLPIKDLAADDAHLHLWTTNGFIFECVHIFNAWGFEFKSSFVWVKPEIGIGNYWRNAHEILLTAVRGNAKRFNDKNLRSWIECSRGAHSSKPQQVRHMLERASPGPRLELFAREEVENWDCWGDQVSPTLLSMRAVA